MPTCAILHDLMYSWTYIYYLNGDSQTSLFTSDLQSTVQSHAFDSHSNMLIQYFRSKRNPLFFLPQQIQMFSFSSSISSCFACCLLAASCRLLAQDLCPLSVLLCNFLIVGATTIFSCTKSLSFYCPDSSLKPFSSPHATLALWKGYATLSVYLSDFDFKCFQATSCAKVQLQS